MDESNEPPPGTFLADFLALAAWLVLIGGVVAAVATWLFWGAVEVPGAYGGTRRAYDASAIWIGIGLAFGSIVQFLWMKAVAEILRHVIALREHQAGRNNGTA